MGTWNYVVNQQQFTDQYGEGAAVRYAEVIGDIAARMTPGDREGALEIVNTAFDEHGFDMPEMMRDKIAENLTLAEHDRVVIRDEFDNVIAEHSLPSDREALDEENRPHIDPESDSRPTYS